MTHSPIELRDRRSAAQRTLSLSLYIIRDLNTTTISPRVRNEIRHGTWNFQLTCVHTERRHELTMSILLKSAVPSNTNTTRAFRITYEHKAIGSAPVHAKVVDRKRNTLFGGLYNKHKLSSCRISRGTRKKSETLSFIKTLFFFYL